MEDLLNKIFLKGIWGLIKFYLVYFGFGIFASIILYASADVQYLLKTGESLFLRILSESGNMSESEAAKIVLTFLSIAFESVPFNQFFEATLGIAFDSNLAEDLIPNIIGLIQSGQAKEILIKGFEGYDAFLRDFSVMMSAAFVLYAVSHFKDKIAGQGISVWLGFALASVFWIFAAYTFGQTITLALEAFVNPEKWKILYIIIILTAIGLEALIHAYGGNCAVLPLVGISLCKFIFNLIKSAFAWFLCKLLIESIISVDTGNANTIVLLLRNTIGMIISAGVFFCISLLESKLTALAEKPTKNKQLFALKQKR